MISNTDFPEQSPNKSLDLEPVIIVHARLFRLESVEEFGISESSPGDRVWLKLMHATTTPKMTREIMIVSYFIIQLQLLKL